MSTSFDVFRQCGRVRGRGYGGVGGSTAETVHLGCESLGEGCGGFGINTPYRTRDGVVWIEDWACLPRIFPFPRGVSLRCGPITYGVVERRTMGYPLSFQLGETLPNSGRALGIEINPRWGFTTCYLYSTYRCKLARPRQHKSGSFQMPAGQRHPEVVGIGRKPEPLRAQSRLVLS